MAITAVALGPEYRTSALRRLGEEQFDILVIGAGVVGAGAALDRRSSLSAHGSRFTVLGSRFTVHGFSI